MKRANIIPPAEEQALYVDVYAVWNYTKRAEITLKACSRQMLIYLSGLQVGENRRYNRRQVGVEVAVVHVFLPPITAAASLHNRVARLGEKKKIGRNGRDVKFFKPHWNVF